VALPLERRDDVSLSDDVLDGTPAPRAAELYVGGVGLFHGMRDRVDMQLALDNWSVALGVLQRNNPGLRCVQDDMANPATREWLCWELQRLNVSVLLAGVPCTYFSAAGTRLASLGVEHLYYTLETAVGARSCRVLLIENVPGLEGTPEMQNFLAFARLVGFDVQQAVTTGGDSCYLPQTRTRMAYVLARPGAGEHDRARMEAAVRHFASLAALQSGSTGYQTVREACSHLPGHSERAERRRTFFLAVPRNKQGRQVYTWDGPAPTTRSSSYHARPTPTTPITPRARDHTQDTAEIARATYLNWEELKAVHTLEPSFQWPEPARGERSAHAQVLANALPQRMGYQWGEMLHYAGVFAEAAT
jgi:site-specific DNA-cytosine methylase